MFKALGDTHAADGVLPCRGYSTDLIYTGG